MTDYQKMYQEKLTTPDKIAQQVQSGWLFLLHHSLLNIFVLID